MPKKKHIKNKKKKIFILISIFILIITFLCIYYGFGKNIKNIYIFNNKVLKDQEIIELAHLENYPNFYTTRASKIAKNIKKSPFVKEAKVKKGFLSIKIYIEEYRPLFIKEDNKSIVLENKEELLNDINLDIPSLVNYVPDTKYDELIEKYKKIDAEIASKISEIRYYPNEYDEDRFLLYMNDQNYVYVTLTKFDILNKYNKTVKKLDGKKGILYLDSGNYFEIKE